MTLPVHFQAADLNFNRALASLEQAIRNLHEKNEIADQKIAALDDAQEQYNKCISCDL